MRCLFTHKWVVGNNFDLRSRDPDISFVIPYRTCERCGTMQRGICDASWGDMSWETMREGVYVISEQIRIVRQPISRLDKLAHSLGLRRSRMTDQMGSKQRSPLILR